MSMTEERLAEIERRLGRLEAKQVRIAVDGLWAKLAWRVDVTKRQTMESLTAANYDLRAMVADLAGALEKSARRLSEMTRSKCRLPGLEEMALHDVKAALTPRVREIAAEVEAQK